ncbi:hypothetical protein LEP1GSC186_0502 [Leptospira noguchii serovar Autumnalis str. ZUN142]|uniref:Uncharacterized protein n=1 Tax=Leptospira noguchii serovar Autumnalis str. ZUN142 TaxID=1085540 RepID=M6UC01_9LEPT|nr:hypothetical protein LEP1GSC186_0502 [Leptospira noguchii serovar Autumnalis str. ZUN142]
MLKKRAIVANLFILSPQFQYSCINICKPRAKIYKDSFFFSRFVWAFKK